MAANSLRTHLYFPIVLVNVVKRVVPPGWRKVICPVPVFLTYSTLSTSAPPLLGLEKLISSRSFILSSGMEEGTLEILSSLLETLRWTYTLMTSNTDLNTYTWNITYKSTLVYFSKIKAVVSSTNRSVIEFKVQICHLFIYMLFVAVN